MSVIDLDYDPIAAHAIALFLSVTDGGMAEDLTPDHATALIQEAQEVESSGEVGFFEKFLDYVASHPLVSTEVKSALPLKQQPVASLPKAVRPERPKIASKPAKPKPQSVVFEFNPSAIARSSDLLAFLNSLEGTEYQEQAHELKAKFFTVKQTTASAKSTAKSTAKTQDEQIAVNQQDYNTYGGFYQLRQQHGVSQAVRLICAQTGRTMGSSTLTQYCVTWEKLLQASPVIRQLFDQGLITWWNIYANSRKIVLSEVEAKLQAIAARNKEKFDQTTIIDLRSNQNETKN